MLSTGMTACEGRHIGGDEVDYEQSAYESCVWQQQCLDDFQREFGTVQHCIELELYRHSEPENCLRANEGFKRCMSGLTCTEFAQYRAQYEALTTQSDAGIPDNLPCLLDLLFYNERCAEWSCDSGQIVNRQDVCDGEDDCADHTDEAGCP
jgi:hypothetical protein